MSLIEKWQRLRMSSFRNLGPLGCNSRQTGRAAKKLSEESGQTLVIVALSLVVVLGFVGLATDVGMLMHAKRNMQIVADSVAIAGASELNFSTAAANVQSAGWAAAAQNGAPNGSNGVTIGVDYPPQIGPHAGDAGYVEAIASRNVNTVFMRLFGRPTMQVSARAVATNGGKGDLCVHVLNQHAPSAMDLQGSFTVSFPGCGVMIESDSTTALNFTGAGGSLSAKWVGVVGDASGHTEDSTPAPQTGVVPESDPFASLPAPSYDSSSCSAPPTSGAWGPATTGGTVCYSPPVGNNGKPGTGITVPSGTVLNPGTYVFTADVTFSGDVSGDGVTLYLLGGLTATNGNLELSAPAYGTGTYGSLLIYEARGDTSPLTLDVGSAYGTLKGIIYAPDGELVLHDSGGDINGGLHLITDLIVNTLYDQTSTLSLESYTQSGNASPLTAIKLVE